MFDGINSVEMPLPYAGANASVTRALEASVNTIRDNGAVRADDYTPRPAQIRWLLDSDPAIRWQVMRDLTGDAPDAIAAERSRVATEVWGAQLLAAQSSAGDWPGGQWDLVTLWSLVVLKDLGLDPASSEARIMIDRIDKGLVFKPLNNRPFLHGETEPCINGRILGTGAYFKEPNEALANQLLGEQLEDGGWNCEAPKSRRSSFHTTICVLEGLLEYERAGRGSAALTKVRATAERVSPRAAHVSLAANRRSRRQTLAALLGPNVLALRCFARTRLSAGCGNQARQPGQGGHRSRDEAPSPEWALAAEPSSSRTDSIRDGDRCRQGEPLEHASRVASPWLVPQLHVIAANWAFSPCLGLEGRLESAIDFGAARAFSGLL